MTTYSDRMPVTKKPHYAQKYCYHHNAHTERTQKQAEIDKQSPPVTC